MKEKIKKLLWELALVFSILNLIGSIIMIQEGTYRIYTFLGNLIVIFILYLAVKNLFLKK